VVYEAEDLKTSTRVALKQLSVARDRAALRRFQREAALLERLAHMGVPRVYASFDEGDVPYLAMELVEGDTLVQLLPPGAAFPYERALRVLRDVAEVLDYLHAQKPPIVFRDLKPSNVMITRTGGIKLVDFGIAWSPSADMTQAMGTHGYAPPEQYAGGECNTGMDIYALGALAHRLLSGVEPPPALGRVSTPELPALRTVKPPLSPAAIAWVESLLAYFPNRRPRDMKDVILGLRAISM